MLNDVSEGSKTNQNQTLAQHTAACTQKHTHTNTCTHEHKHTCTKPPFVTTYQMEATKYKCNTAAGVGEAAAVFGVDGRSVCWQLSNADETLKFVKLHNFVSCRLGPQPSHTATLSSYSVPTPRSFGLFGVDKVTKGKNAA